MKKLSNEEYLKCIFEKREDKGMFYDYSLVDYKGNSKKIIIICPLHGIFEQTASLHKSGGGCYSCGRMNAANKLVKYGLKYTTETYLELISKIREDKASYYDYSKVIYTRKKNKIIIICPLHGEFSQGAETHKNGSGCPQCETNRRKKTNYERFGVENISYADEIKQVKMQTMRRNWGVDYPSQSKLIRNKQKQTCLDNHGVEFPMQSKEIRDKGIATKIENGSYGTFSSREATSYFRKYVKQKGYTLEQVAFYDKEQHNSEWGYNIGRWVLFDFVAFEPGHKGNKDKVIEVVEYHGPWHYTRQDVEMRGKEKAKPWKECNMTIEQSFDLDTIKYNFAKSLTNNVTVIWAYGPKRNKNNDT